MDVGYVQMLSRYNAWQNTQLAGIIEAADGVDFYRDQGAFFGSVMATLNHIHWADLLWMGRLSTIVEEPTGVPDDWAEHTTSIADWRARRAALDEQIIAWAQGLTAADLNGTIKWRSNAMQRDFDHPKSICIAHMFSHQTHHRGQVHAMLTASGLEAPVSDIVFMSESA